MNTTHEEFVSLETAKMLRKAGFDWLCNRLYGLDVRHNGESIDEDEEYELKAEGRASEIEYIEGGRIYESWHTNRANGQYSAPTQAVAQRWLREVKSREVVVDISMYRLHEYEPMVGIINQYAKENELAIVWKLDGTEKRYETYEAALEAGLQKCLTMILEKK